MSFGLITLRRPTAVQPFRRNTCWDLYARKEIFQTHFKADKDCLDSSNDYIAIAQSCEIFWYRFGNVSCIALLDCPLPEARNADCPLSVIYVHFEAQREQPS